MSDREEFDMMLTAPITGRTRVSQRALDDEGAGFLAFMSQVSGGET